MPKQIIVSAAMRYELNPSLIITGARHFDNIMHNQIQWVFSSANNASPKPALWKQGFIDNFGNFHDRFEAYRIAMDAGQIGLHRPKSGNPHSIELYSEDLY